MRFDQKILALNERMAAAKARAEEIRKEKKPLDDALDAALREASSLHEKRYGMALQKLVGQKVVLLYDKFAYGSDARIGLMISVNRSRCVVRFGNRDHSYNLFDVTPAEEGLLKRLLTGEELEVKELERA